MGACSSRANPRRGIRVNIVRFSPSARTAWHSHAAGQTLYVTEGIGQVQSRGHIAMWGASAKGPESEWGALVTDAEYLGRE